jgi:hypothetical protein
MGQKWPGRRSIHFIDSSQERGIAPGGEKIRMQFERKTVFKGFLALVFMINRERWLTNRAA